MRIYSTAKEHFLTPAEIAEVGRLGVENGAETVAAQWGLVMYDNEPAVILVHVIGTAGEGGHDERLYVNNDLILADRHWPNPPAPEHVCAERTGVLLARALNIPLDERRVHEDDYATKGHAMSLLAFSATVDWPRRGGYAK